MLFGKSFHCYYTILVLIQWVNLSSIIVYSEENIMNDEQSFEGKTIEHANYHYQNIRSDDNDSRRRRKKGTKQDATFRETSEVNKPSLQYIQFMVWVRRFRAKQQTLAPQIAPTSAPVAALKPTSAPARKPTTTAPIQTLKPAMKVPLKQPTLAPQIAPTSAPVAALKPTSAPVRKPTTTAPIQTLKPAMKVPPPPTPPSKGSMTFTKDEYCGCQSCTVDVWNLKAEEHTCGERIEWIQLNDPNVDGDVIEACRIVSEQFPKQCRLKCHPDICDEQPALSPTAFSDESNLYCYPDLKDRIQHTDVWGNYIVQVREDKSPCDPSANMFSKETVSVSDDTLTLQYKKLNGIWTGSEVRVVRPLDDGLFNYGTYSYSLKNVTVKDIVTGAVTDNALPPSLVLGFFTWDLTDDYLTRENHYNREVDIELSRWKYSTAPDAMFLVQPSGTHKFNFYTGGIDKSLNQGGHTYGFTWNPGEIIWNTDAGDNGQTYTYSTEDAISKGLPDYVQCLPNHIEIRFNLWNLLGTEIPMGMNDNEMIEVIIDNFTYTPSTLIGIDNGKVCSKDCQCLPTSTCIKNICTVS